MDILKMLRNIPEWNDILKLPSKLKELEQRVAALEEQDTSFDTCPSCKKKTFKLISSKPDPMMAEMGVVERLYRCSHCSFEESVKHTP